jgi:hypothetical protein
MTWRALSISPYHTGKIGLAITSTSGYVDVEDLRFTGAAIGVSGAPTVLTVASGGAVVTGTLSASSSAHLSSTLNVGGITTLADDLLMLEDIAALTHTGTTGLAITSTSGYVDVDDIRFTGASIGVSGTPTVVTVASGGAAVTGTLSASSSTSLSSILDVGGVTTLADDLLMSEDAAALTHTGTAGLAITSNTGYVDVEDVRFTGAAIGVSSTPTVLTVASGGAAVTGTLSATSSAHLSSTLGVAGVTTIADDLLMLEDAAALTHTGTTGLAITSNTGYVDVEDLRFTGASIGINGDTDILTLSSATLTVAGATVTTSLDVNGVANIAGTLTLSGAMNLSSTLDVAGITTLADDLLMTETAAALTHTAAAGATSGINITSTNGFVNVEDIRFTGAKMGTSDVPNMITVSDEGVHVNGSLYSSSFYSPMIGTSNVPDIIGISDDGIKVNGTLTTTSFAFTGRAVQVDPGLTDCAWFQRVKLKHDELLSKNKMC